MIVLTAAGVPRRHQEALYEEQLRVADLSVGTFHIPAGGRDPQQPHTEDEIYVVTGGAARLWTPTQVVDVRAGSVVFVPAGEQHRFVDVTADLTVLVIFGPAEHSRGDGVGLEQTAGLEQSAGREEPARREPAGQGEPAGQEPADRQGIGERR
ncbi:cupin domain-containing protein [Georgenia sp. TF02-10]|uniref:cupin domain-containing protein n=1 Tax=Georgenia sp. TF02-10 TaxID=2917725 RepID=UPI001FA70122|nr:cupin domain-containing protein [Georgenia sp. TF02-10]UNX56111.1 cupin domain-containing protein [Georgenia sp. TF02-10]